MRRSQVVCFFGLVITAILVTGCGSFGLGRVNHSHSESRHQSSSHSSTAETATEITPLNMEPNDTSARLSIEMRVESGAMAWVLFSPDEAIMWEGELSAGDSIDETQSFNPIPGTWRLEIVKDDAIGGYDVEWLAHN